MDKITILSLDAEGDVQSVSSRPMLAPDKVYGDFIPFASTVNTSFRGLGASNVGVLLNGLKGSGKTLLAWTICRTVSDDNPGCELFYLSDSMSGSKLLSYLVSQRVKECVIFIDEFEKKYSDMELQESLLSLLDGGLDIKMMFILTSNVRSVSEFMINRVGRIRYFREFQGLDDEVIEEIVDDNLYPDLESGSPRKSDITTRIKNTIELLGEISFDNLKGIITECNIHRDKDYNEIIKYLNIRTEPQHYTVTLLVGNSRYKAKISYHPLAVSVVDVDYKVGQWEWKSFKFEISSCTVTKSSSQIRITDEFGNLGIFSRDLKHGQSGVTLRALIEQLG